MEKIFKLAIVAALLYGAYTYGLPWFKGTVDDTISGNLDDSAGGEQGLCVDAAERAVDGFGNRIARFSPPIDTSDWNIATADISDDIDRAEEACGCQAESCRKAAEVVEKLGEWLMHCDDRVSEGSGLPMNAAGKLDGFYYTLGQAEKLARAGK